MKKYITIKNRKKVKHLNTMCLSKYMYSFRNKIKNIYKKSLRAVISKKCKNGFDKSANFHDNFYDDAEWYAYIPGVWDTDSGFQFHFTTSMIYFYPDMVDDDESFNNIFEDRMTSFFKQITCRHTLKIK